MAIASEVHNLRLKFPGVKELQFRDLNFSVKQGEKVLLLGPSGCGKSTLLQVLSGLIPNSVEIPMKCDHIVIPEHWAFVFQDPDTQFCMPYVDEELAFVLENLQIPREQMRARMLELLRKVDLHFDDLHIPIQECSQGMKQRLAIASALALEPEVIFLDEPTALLDPEGTEQIWKTMKEAAQEQTLIVVEHKIEHIMDIIDRVVLFNYEGQIIADGPKTQVFQDHQMALKEYGIWYPEVWKEYTFSQGYLQMMEARHSELPRRILEPDGPWIELKDVSGLRGKEVKIEVQQSEVWPGEWIIIAGENGAGKSTLLLALMQLIRTKGSYQLLGKPIESYKGQLFNTLAFVFQNPEFQFITDTVFDELSYSLLLQNLDEPSIQRLVDEMAVHFSLAAHLDNHPYQLSTGQKRRLSVATAMMDKQPLLLLDEPTFGQDARNTFALLEKLEAWRAQGRTILMVSHDLEIIQYFATRVWHIKQGQLTADMEPTAYLKQYHKHTLLKEAFVCS